MATATKTQSGNKADAYAEMFKLPAYDLDSVLAAQRKNLEALVEANRVALDGYKNAVEKQAELVRSSISEMSDVASDAFSGKTPEANASKQIELGQNFARTALDGMREVTEIAVKSNQDAYDVLQKRFQDGVDEIRTSTK